MSEAYRILLVDDEPHARTLAAGWLSQLCHSGENPMAEQVKLYMPDICRIRRDGEEYIISLIMDGNFDLVLLDINLNVWFTSLHAQSGLRILRQLRLLGYRGKILVYSSYDLHGNSLVKQLADDLFVKSFSYRELLKKIGDLLLAGPKFAEVTAEKMQELAGSFPEPKG